MNALSNLQMFVRVVEEGSFSAAARFRGIAPSSVSRQVSQLEGELGARLFHRTTRRQSLTETGEIYFQYARRIAADLDEARAAVDRLVDTPSGSLHITVEPDFAMGHTSPASMFGGRFHRMCVAIFLELSLRDSPMYGYASGPHAPLLSSQPSHSCLWSSRPKATQNAGPGRP